MVRHDDGGDRDHRDDREQDHCDRELRDAGSAALAWYLDIEFLSGNGTVLSMVHDDEEVGSGLIERDAPHTGARRVAYSMSAGIGNRHE